MNESTKTVLLNRVFVLNRDIDWNEKSILNSEELISKQKEVLAKLESERNSLIEDLKAAGVEVDVPVQS